jgi:hypothetical protein
LSLFTLGFVSAAKGSRNPLAEQVRAVNDRFKDVGVAVSVGYAPAASRAAGANDGDLNDLMNKDIIRLRQSTCHARRNGWELLGGTGVWRVRVH